MPTHRDHPVIPPSRARMPAACALALGLACSTSDGSAAADSGTGEVETSGSTRSDPADGTSTFPVLSGDGRRLSFESDASDLVADDTNETRDVFRRGPLS